MATFALAVGLVALLAQPGAGQQAKRTRVRGYVVHVSSPFEFSLDDIRVTEDRTYRVHLEDAGERVPDVLPIGTDVEVEGQLDSLSGEVLATTVKRRSPAQDQTHPTTTISAAVPIEPGERRLWQWWKVKITEPDFDRRRGGDVTILNETHYEIIANADVQRYIAELGASLVPRYQRELSDDDPAKIPFKFYVVKGDAAGAMAMANGLVLVYTRTFEILKNEAQLAVALAHEIAHATQKHTWQLDRMAPNEIRVGFERAYENQADRLALEYASSAGYDPREAATTWKLMTQKLGFTPLKGTHENFSVRRALIMGELEAHYHQLDYSGLRIEDRRYRQMAERAKKPN